jgi:DNA-binding CsgD family transcriptional regulator
MSPQHDQRENVEFGSVAAVYGQSSNAAGLIAGAIGTTINAIRSLTPRQRDVLAVMMQGKCNKAICRCLNLAEPTVKNHVTAILKALNATNRTEAVVKVARASASPTSYTYTIIGYSTFLAYSAPRPSGADEMRRSSRRAPSPSARCGQA